MSDFNLDVLRKYLENECTAEESALVEAWYDQYNTNEHIDIEAFCRHIMSLDKRMRVLLLAKPVKKMSVTKLVAVAAVLVFITFGVWFFTRSHKSSGELYAPSENNVMVYLDNNQSYNLSELSFGDTLKAKSYAVTKNNEGGLIYLSYPTLDPASSNVIYNTIKTKAGGTLSVTLPDSSVVWINANSEITYPVNNIYTYRKVALKGEAYFEVKKVANGALYRPFYVTTQHNTIKVLGTKFNVNAYDDNYTVALSEGKVAIANQHMLNEDTSFTGSYNLSPGQYYEKGVVANADEIEKYTDWKDNYFYFTGLTLNAIKQRLQNWYGVEIEVDKAIGNKTFFGQVSRSRSLNQVLNLLKEIGAIDYTITNGKVTITSTK